MTGTSSSSLKLVNYKEQKMGIGLVEVWALQEPFSLSWEKLNLVATIEGLRENVDENGVKE